MYRTPRWLPLALVALFACGPTGGDYPYLRGEGCETTCEDAGVDAGRSDAGPPVIPDEPLEGWDTEGAGPLTGLFAVEVTIPARAVIEVETRQLYRLRIVQRGADTRLRITPCRFALPSIPSVATLTLPPRLEEVLRGLAVDSEGPFLSASEPLGAELATPTATVLLGASLDVIETDPLPTSASLGSALDQDEDGQPGVTLGAETVLCRGPEEIYVALRASVTMRAAITDLARFEGDVTPTLEQSILGTSDDCLTAAANLEIELLEGSRFLALRVGDDEDLDGNGNVSCPELTYHAVALFGDQWASPE